MNCHNFPTCHSLIQQVFIFSFLKMTADRKVTEHGENDVGYYLLKAYKGQTLF